MLAKIHTLRQWKRITAFGLFWAIYSAGCLADGVIELHAQNALQRERVLKTMIGEAADQGERGMQAVAEVIRRRGCLRPFKASRRPDLDRFVKRQGNTVWRTAERAWDRSAESNITKNATHYENVRRFGFPKFATRMKLVTKIGSHWFWRE